MGVEPTCTRARGKHILVIGSSEALSRSTAELAPRHLVLSSTAQGPWPPSDLWVVLPDPATDGILRRRAESARSRPPILVLDEEADVAACRDWLRWGAADYLPVTGDRWPIERIEEVLAWGLAHELPSEVAERAASREQDYCDDLERIITFIDGIRDGVIFSDADGAIIATNRCLERQLGLPSLSSLGARIQTLPGPPELIETLREGFAEVLGGSVREWSREVMLDDAGDETTVLDIAVLGLAGGEEAACLGGVAIVRDVSAVRRTERMKSQFLSIVSHELRAPLTAIRTFVSMLCQGRLGEVLPAQQQVLDDICEQSIRLEHEIDKIINLARLESEDFERGDEEFAVRELIQVACRGFRGMVEAKGLSLHCELPAPDVCVRADFEDIKRALQALVENAIKFTPTGGDVVVSAGSTDDEVFVRVADTGIGIASRHRGLIFEKFQQIENPLTRQFGGAGLGLSVARRIVRAHASDVEVESEPGQGAVFSFRLPRCRPAVPMMGADG